MAVEVVLADQTVLELGSVVMLTLKLGSEQMIAAFDAVSLSLLASWAALRTAVALAMSFRIGRHSMPRCERDTCSPQSSKTPLTAAQARSTSSPSVRSHSATRMQAMACHCT